MISVGDTLRRARLKGNLQLEEVSNELKISTRMLQAIEDDQYDKLPGGVFAKSFVRQYARLLGLDEEEIAARMQQAMGPVEETPQFPERPKPGGGSPIQVPKVDEWETVGDKRFRWSGWLSAVVLVAVMLVCSAVYTWMQRPKSSGAAQARPPAPAAPAPSGIAEPGSAAPGAAAPTPSPVEPAAAPAQAAEQNPAEPKPAEPLPVEQQPAAPVPAAARATPPNPDATVHVEITADEAVWVLARADGKYAFSATMEAHSTRTVEGVKDVMLRLGNAGGVTISLNGKPIGPAGPTGQVRTIQFTSGGFQIVPPKAPAVLDDRL